MKHKNDFIALFSGVLFAVFYPPFKAGFLAYAGFLPLFYLMNAENGEKGFRLGYLWGFGFNVATLYWIIWATPPGGLASILFLPLYSGIFFYTFFYVFRKIRFKALIFFPFFWTAFEYLRSLGVIGFPWTSLAYTQTYYPELIQYSSYTSAYGVSFWMCWVNVLFYFLFKNVNNYKLVIRYGILIFAIILLPYLYGGYVINQENFINENRKIRVSMIQANIDPDVKWDEEFKNNNFSIYEELSYAAMKDNPELIIWPETAATEYIRLPQGTRYRRLIESIVDSTKTPLVTGTLDWKYVPDYDEYKYFNSAFYFKPGARVFEDYAKIKLVPFGERVPFEEYLPFLNKLEMGQGDFFPGTETKVFRISTKGDVKNNVKFSIGICFESIFPDLIRKFCHKRAEFIAIITNDCWFGRTSAPFQHAQISVFRAIENRTGIARNANTGVTMIIDPYGRTQKQTPIFKRRIVSGDVYLRNTETFYTRYGDVFSYVVLTFALMSFLEIACVIEKK